MRTISTALVLVVVAGAALSLGGVAAGSSSESRAAHVVMSVALTCKLKIGKLTKIGHAKGGRKTCTARPTSDGKGGWS